MDGAGLSRMTVGSYATKISAERLNAFPIREESICGLFVLCPTFRQSAIPQERGNIAQSSRRYNKAASREVIDEKVAR